jgi:hypothetical protein
MIIEFHSEDPHFQRTALPLVRAWLLKNIEGPKKIVVYYSRREFKVIMSAPWG